MDSSYSRADSFRGSDFSASAAVPSAPPPRQAPSAAMEEEAAPRVIIPPLEPWPQASKGRLKAVLDDFLRLCRGQGHDEIGAPPELNLRRCRSYQEKASAMLVWCLQMRGHPSAGSMVYQENNLSELSMERYRFLWQLYNEFQRCAREEADGYEGRGVGRGVSGTDARTVLSDASHLRKFSIIYETLIRIDQVTARVHELICITENITDYCLPDKIRASYTHQSLVRLWNQDDDDAARKQTDFEILVLYLLECANTHSYRKQDGLVYEQKILEWDGMRIGTRAWVPADFHSRRGPDNDDSSIKAFVHRFCRKENRKDMWSRYHNLNN
jgi:hypothetical protein